VDVFVVDAFAERPYSGNPAAVVLLTEPRGDQWMQAVAAEMNLSETAFVDLIGAGRPGSPLPLRWFTPSTEVDLCGHATLAAAHVLGGELRFGTRSGVLSATSRQGGWVELDFPSDRATAVPVPDELAAALPGVTVRSVHRGVADLMVEVASAEEVRELRPDFAALTTLSQRADRGVLVTAEGTETDFVSRCFFPGQGVGEDPVTGSAHCLLGPFWGARLGRDELTGAQLSARGGLVRMQLRQDRIGLAGQAHTILSGRLQY
jgi:predicted PhzF superfamily epimerase YddE/YHI9